MPTDDPTLTIWRHIAAEFIAVDRIAAAQPRRVIGFGYVTTEVDCDRQAQGSNYRINGWGR